MPFHPLPSLQQLLTALEHAFQHHTELRMARGGVELTLPEQHVVVRPHPSRTAPDLQDFPKELARGLAEVAGLGLASALTDPTPDGTRLRMELVTALARVEASLRQGKERSDPAALGDPLITTADAAAQLGMSRPHVSMLCDQGKLGHVTRSEGGHRRIRQSAVDAYRRAHGGGTAVSD
jgi:excisionase family DNA binding protein